MLFCKDLRNRIKVIRMINNLLSKQKKLSKNTSAVEKTEAQN